MKKIVLIICCFLPINLIAQEVSRTEAEKVARNFYLENHQYTKKEKLTELKFKKEAILKSGKAEALYVFNNETNNGFVVVSANKAVYPILAYSLNESFNEKEIPRVVKEWLEGYEKQIKSLGKFKSSGSFKAKLAWDKYSDPSFETKLNSSGLKGLKKDVAPLLTTTWNQGAYYNALCPETSSGGSGGRVWTGCVATAQGQVMKYYNYPEHGVGEHSYNHSVYGEQSANFDAATYNWSNMPSSLSSHNNDVATLLYHCGVSVNMNYGPSGSGASGGAPQNSLVNYFKYSTNTLYTSKYSYTDEDWKNLLKREIDESRPMYYVGRGTGGHAFVCDGYQGDDYFHFNWGWGGSYNGYFYVDDLTPGSMNFTNSQAVLVGAVPQTMETDLDSAGAIVLNCGVAYNGTTVDGQNIVNKYTGLSWHNTGKEKVHKITTSYPGRISATLSNLNGKNIDVFILKYADRNCLLASGDSIAIADDAEAGTYYILVDGRYGAEGSYTLTINCPDNQADLIVENARVNPMYIVPGAQLKVDALVRNIGNSVAAENVLSFYVSDNQVLSGDDVYIGNSSIVQLNPQSKTAVSKILNLPASTEAGMKYLILKVDADNDVAETDELLNTCSANFQVPASGIMNCSSAISLQNGVWYNGNTSTDGTAAISDYSWFFGLDNKEVIHEFTPGFSGLAKLSFTENLDGDLNLILLSGCNENACINTFTIYHGMGDTLHHEFYVASGITYYLVADGNNQNGNSEGAYSLKIDFPDECPLPVISGSSPDKCIGDGTVFLQTNWEYSNFQWYKDGSPIDGQINSSVSTGENGLYSVKVIENGCAGESAGTLVRYSAKPSASSIAALSGTEFCEGSSVTLELSTGGGYSYQWTRNNSNIDNAIALSYAAAKSGTYKAKVTNESCTIESNAIEVIVNHSAYDDGEVLPVSKDSLITCWLFDSWGTDDSGYGNYAGIMGAKQCKDKTDKYSAFRFNGLDNYIYSSKQFEHPDTFTIAVWFKSSSVGPIMGFDSEKYNVASTNFGRCIYLDNNGLIRFGVDDGAKNNLVSAASYNDDNWHLIVGSLSPDGMKLYVDGKLETQLNTVTSGKVITGYWKIANGNLDSWPDCSEQYFNGSIDNIRIYKRALTDDEVEILYEEQRISINLEEEAICAASGSTNIIIENSEPGISYQLVNNIGATLIGTSVEGNAGTIHLPTGTLNTSTGIRIMAENNSTTCVNELDSVYNIAVGTEITPEVHITSNASFEDFCAGDTINFTQNSLYAGNTPVYSWMVNGVETSTINEIFPVSSLDNQDVVSLRLTSSVECANPKTVISNEIIVNINELPIVNLGIDTAIHMNESLLLDAGSGEYTYLWNTDETSQQITINGNIGIGEYYYSVLVTDNYNCSNSDTIAVAVAAALNINFQDNQLSIKAWPNPVRDFLFLEFKNSFENKLGLELINYSGQKILKRNYDSGKIVISDKLYLGKYKKGVYFLVLKNSSFGKKVVKIVVE